MWLYFERGELRFSAQVGEYSVSEFDPYRKWLGIPPKDQPPHYYRLLGIEKQHVLLMRVILGKRGMLG
jgi:hypothetical protein